jgi:hypothetical protein
MGESEMNSDIEMIDMDDDRVRGRVEYENTLRLRADLDWWLQYNGLSERAALEILFGLADSMNLL